MQALPPPHPPTGKITERREMQTYFLRLLPVAFFCASALLPRLEAKRGRFPLRCRGDTVSRPWGCGEGVTGRRSCWQEVGLRRIAATWTQRSSCPRRRRIFGEMGSPVVSANAHTNKKQGKRAGYLITCNPQHRLLDNHTPLVFQVTHFKLLISKTY